VAKFQQGTYLVRVTNQGFDESKEKKTPYFWLEFQPQGMVNPENPDGPLYGCDDTLRSTSLYLTEKTIERTRETLGNLGWNGQRFQDLEPGGAHSFVGQELNLECRHEQFDDKVFERWEFPYAGSETKQNISGLARKLDALFGRAAKPAAQPAANRPATRTPPPKAEAVPATWRTASGEDIPFVLLINLALMLASASAMC